MPSLPIFASLPVGTTVNASYTTHGNSHRILSCATVICLPVNRGCTPTAQGSRERDPDSKRFRGGPLRGNRTSSCRPCCGGGGMDVRWLAAGFVLGMLVFAGLSAMQVTAHCTWTARRAHHRVLRCRCAHACLAPVSSVACGESRLWPCAGQCRAAELSVQRHGRGSAGAAGSTASGGHHPE